MEKFNLGGNIEYKMGKICQTTLKYFTHSSRDANRMTATVTLFVISYMRKQTYRQQSVYSKRHFIKWNVPLLR